MILKTLKDLTSRYEDLSAGDIYIGNLPAAPVKTALLIDLMKRGIRLIPSPLARILNASKTAQSTILSSWMLPDTRIIHRRKDLMDATNQYTKEGIGPVVTKQDRMHCGHGIRRWDSMEILYNVVSMLPSAYPFVLQPYLEDFTDVRTIIVGDFVEAYVRANPYNFRKNLSSGGTGGPFSLSKDMEAFCRSAMTRGRFPFAHMDLQVIDDNTGYLSEIALNGGIAGARIHRKELEGMKQALLEKMMNSTPL